MTLKDLRIKNGYTKKEVAEAIGVCLNTYRKYENYAGIMPASKVLAIARFYNIKISEISV